MLVEVCANSLQSALNAEAAGADRIELCAALGVGGITPSHGLLKQVLAQLTIPVHVLIRPRGGHFTYSNTEFNVMCEDIEYCKALGVAGVVSGVLTSDFALDVGRTNELISLAGAMSFTFHRAFDWVTNPQQALQRMEDMGVATVLTSGQRTSAQEGLEEISVWQQRTALTLMAGGGIGPNNAHLFKQHGIKAIHLSGTHWGNEVAIQDKISMNAPKHLAEHQVAVTNEALIRQTIHQYKKK